MESYEKSKGKEKLSGELDIDNLKDHLNASFDADHMTVSEELIQKTLKAIEAGEAPKTIENKKKPNKFPVFHIGGVAAAVVLLVVGIAVARDKFMLPMKQADTVSETLADSAVAEKYATAEKSKENSIAGNGTNEPSGDGTTATENSLEVNGTEIADSGETLKKAAGNGENNTEYGASARSSDMTADNSSAASEASQNGTESIDGAGNETAGSGTESFDTAKEDAAGKAISETTEDTTMGLFADPSLQGTILFSDVLPSVEQVRSFTILRGNKDEVEIMDNTKDAQELYELLGAYTLTISENLSNMVNYEIIIETKENSSYTITINDGIRIIKKDSRNVQTNYYFANNVEELKSRLYDFIIELKK